MGKEDMMKDYFELMKNFSWSQVEQEFTWHTSGRLNIVHEAIDRHVHNGKEEQIALIFEGWGRKEQYTFGQLKEMTDKFAGILTKVGINPGDRIAIYMPRIPELYISLLGIIKAGAVAVPFFEGYKGKMVEQYLQDSEAVSIITTAGLRKNFNLENAPNLKHVFVYGNEEQVRTGEYWWQGEMEQAQAGEYTIWVNKDHPMLLLYTSGSTGTPKGVIHVHEAMLHLYHTGKLVLSLGQKDEVFWCTADPGWITGISYGVLAPWLTGTTNFVRGERFHARGWYSMIEKYRVNVWYSTPTSFRMLMNYGDSLSSQYDFSSIRHIFSVGEALNPAVLRWGQKVFGVPIRDTWWMTETGGILIANIPEQQIKPGSMGRPIPGIYATVIDNKGRELAPMEVGNLAVRTGWPGMMRGVWRDEANFNAYFKFSPWYLTGDLAYRDHEGYFWYQGRSDDIINTSGGRVGPYEVESRLVEHPAVMEAGVIGKPDPLRGEVIKAYLKLEEDCQWEESLEQELKDFALEVLPAYAIPQEFEVINELPKTRSGKISRRILKAWELGLPIETLNQEDDV
jgi:acetyl-CoA synthetase